MRSNEGEVLSRPLKAYPELEEARVAQRLYNKMPTAHLRRWEAIDADMHISSFYETTEPNSENATSAIFSHGNWLNIAEVANVLGISKSLLARYIYGIAISTPARLQQIRSPLHVMGRELQSA